MFRTINKEREMTPNAAQAREVQLSIHPRVLGVQVASDGTTIGDKFNGTEPATLATNLLRLFGGVLAYFRHSGEHSVDENTITLRIKSQLGSIPCELLLSRSHQTQIANSILLPVSSLKCCVEGEALFVLKSVSPGTTSLDLPLFFFNNGRASDIKFEAIRHVNHVTAAPTDFSVAADKLIVTGVNNEQYVATAAYHILLELCNTLVPQNNTFQKYISM